MDFNELVSQIAVKVAEKISAMEEKAVTGLPSEEELVKKPKLLILSENHGTACHELLESKTVGHKFDITCALDNDYQCEINQFDVVVLRNLSNASLGKIAEGIADTPFNELVVKAILLGKKIIVPNEEVELFKYRETAPKLYYGMMMQKIELLKNTGIYFCNVEQLEKIILENECVVENLCCIETHKDHLNVVSEVNLKGSMTLVKRVITERDVQSAFEQHMECICVAEKTIITDLAREYAEQRGLSFTIG